MKTVYAVCSTVRTGSSLLCEYLMNTGIAGYPVDFTNKFRLQAFIPEAKPVVRVDYSQLLELIAEYSTDNGVFGIKLPHLPMQALPILKNMQKLEGVKLYYIRMTREDKLKRAISAAKSNSTGIYYSFQSTVAKPVPAYSRKYIESAMKKLEFNDKLWDDFFAVNELDSFKITYEELSDDPSTVIDNVLEFLDIPNPKGFKLPSTRLQKLADETSKNWEELYKKGL